jgi:hypothetical protein
LGGLVEHLPKERILALVKEVDSPRAIIQIASAVQNKPRLAEALIQLKDEALEGLIEAASDLELWEPALLMCSHLNAKQQVRIRSLAQKFEWDDERVFMGIAEELVWASSARNLVC